MALSHALLALLIDEPRSGYDLARRFEGSIGSFWKATHQQIYRELGQMEQKGYLDSETVVQEGRPNKKLYRMTEKGRQYLGDWIGTVSEPCVIREDLLVMTFAGALAVPGALAGELQRRRELHRTELAGYREMEREHYAEPEKLTGPALYGYLALRRGIRYAEEWIAWCDEALAAIAQSEAISAARG